MNDILQLKGTLQERSSENTPSSRNIPKNAPAVNSEQLERLLDELKSLIGYWAEQHIIEGCLIDVYYTDVVAKSNRIKGFLSGSGSTNNSVVGARFANEQKRKHVITHYVSDWILKNTVQKTIGCIELLKEEFGGTITHELIEGLKESDIAYEKYGLSRTSFVNIIVDSHYIDSFKIPDNSANIANRSIITVYKTNKDLVDLMSTIGITLRPEKIWNQTTLLLYPDQIKLLSTKAPYLIAMATEDITNLSLDAAVGGEEYHNAITIDPPNGEPIIGVIDTLFDESVYFSEWVEYQKMIDDDIPTEPRDFVHGTSVSSLIVDGPMINPNLDDGCGRFRVRHFGVATQGGYSAFSIIKTIEEIVTSNRDIRVWNLSLGSDREVSPNFISPEAAALDKIQYENDVIFVIAGTNKRDSELRAEKMIGAPADSINAIVVNSVNSEGDPASYSRKGLVLSFFNKPDVSNYGGDKNDYIRVCTPMGAEFRSGTSYAAPWVTRKVAYLMEVLGLSREVAKALIVDAAAGWNGSTQNSVKLAPIVGFGVVPQNINNIVKSKEDEIKFIMTGIATKWETYTYNLPVPIHNDKHPFIAKATLCYFPNCSVNQGVDYTDTELDIYFGRVKGRGISSINRNKQSSNDGEKYYIYEGKAREFYRKWDNTKHINEVVTKYARKVYEGGMWGLKIQAKDRLEKRTRGVNFGLVVTLKEIHGINRIDDFVHQCELRGWLVNRINLNAKVQIYNKAQEIIEFDT